MPNFYDMYTAYGISPERVGEIMAEIPQREETYTERAARQAYEAAQARLERVQNARAADGQPWYSFEQRREAETDVEEKKKEMVSARNDAAREWREQLQATARAEEQARREGVEAQRRAEIESRVKAEYRAAYLGAGGTPEMFEESWPGIWRKFLREQAETRTTELQRSMAARLHSAF